jgi:hypothetical protein
MHPRGGPLILTMGWTSWGFVIPKRLPKRNLVPQVQLLFILSAMNLKLRLWLLALFLATVGLTSCMSQEGIAPAEGELKSPGGY